LARLAFARLAALCAGEAGPLARELCALGTDELLSEITSRGARVVGRSLAGAPPALRARAMAAAGEPWARAIAAGTLEAVAKEAQREAATLARAAGGTETGAARERLLAIGLAQLKIELEHEHPGSRLRVAGRLPAPLGRSLAGW
jgi:hypothetical protein